MKLTKDQLKALIKEEASRIRKEMEVEKQKASRKSQLESRKEEIMLEMAGMYGEEIEEGLFGIGKTPEQKKQEEAEYKNAVLTHPVAKQWVKFIISKGLAPEMADGQIVAIFKKYGTILKNDNGKIIGFKNIPKLEWDEATKQLVAGKQTFSAPGMTLAEKY